MPSRAKSASRDIALASALTAVAVILGYAESVLLPAMVVPGVRIGLANVAVVVAFATVGARGALAVTIGRVVLVGLVTGTLAGPAGVMALSGALAAWVVTAALVRTGSLFSPYGWSVGGAASHVVAQLVAASALTGSSAPLGFVPLALALSLAAGLGTGALASVMLRRISAFLSHPLASATATGNGEGIRSAAPAEHA